MIDSYIFLQIKYQPYKKENAQSRQLINHQLEKTGLKCSSSVCFLRSQDFSLERSLALAHDAGRITTEGNYAIASSSWCQTATVKFPDMENHIPLRATKHAHDLREVAAETALEMVEAFHIMEKWHPQLSSLPLCSWRDLCYTCSWSAQPRENFRVIFWLVCSPDSSRIAQQSVHCPQPFWASCVWAIQFYRRFNSWRVCPCCELLVCLDFIASRAEGDESRWQCSRCLSKKHLYTCKIYSYCFPMYNSVFLTLSSGEVWMTRIWEHTPVKRNCPCTKSPTTGFISKQDSASNSPKSWELFFYTDRSSYGSG